MHFTIGIQHCLPLLSGEDESKEIQSAILELRGARTAFALRAHTMLSGADDIECVDWDSESLFTRTWVNVTGALTPEAVQALLDANDGMPLMVCITGMCTADQMRALRAVATACKVEGYKDLHQSADGSADGMLFFENVMQALACAALCNV